MKFAKATLAVAGILAAFFQAQANEGLFEQAGAAAQAGDYSRMQQAYEQVLREDPENIRAMNGKAAAQAWRGSYYAAQETYRKALAIEPDNLDALVGLGYAQAWAGDFGEAQASFRQALAVEPGHRDALKGEAYVQLWSGDYEGARAGFEELAVGHEQDADIAVALGQANLHGGDSRAAVQAFDRALAVDPGRNDASMGRRAAMSARPRGESILWYGSTSNADSGLRLAEFAWWAGDRTRIAARYDDSLSLDNPALARRGESAETYAADVLHQFTYRLSGRAEIGRRLLPDGDQDIYRGELAIGGPRGKLTFGAQRGAHELGYDDQLWYFGVNVPIAGRWQVESNNYFSTTGIDSDDEWRSVLNVIYGADAGWELLAGAGYGEVTYADALNPQSVKVAHAKLTVPVFGFHQLHLMLRHEDTPASQFNVAMLGITLRLPQ